MRENGFLSLSEGVSWAGVMTAERSRFSDVEREILPIWCSSWCRSLWSRTSMSSVRVGGWEYVEIEI